MVRIKKVVCPARLACYKPITYLNRQLTDVETRAFRENLNSFRGQRSNPELAPG